MRLYEAIARHTALVMATLAICAVTAALLRGRTETQAPPPARPDHQPPADLGMIPLTVPEITRLLTGPPGHAEHWAKLAAPPPSPLPLVHQRARLARETQNSLASRAPQAAAAGRHRDRNNRLRDDGQRGSVSPWPRPRG